MIATKHLYWLAGLLDGEGCFRSGNMGQPRLIVNMTDEDTVRTAARLLGAQSVRRVKIHRTQRKQQFNVEIGGRRAAGWMMTLYSLMSQRRRQRIREVLTEWKKRRALPGARYRMVTDRTVEVGTRATELAVLMASGQEGG